MSAWRRAATGLVFAGLAGGAPGCTAKPAGQIILAVQTDLSLPKDIDTIRIEVFDEGVPKFRNDYTKLGTADGQIHLPGTLGLIAPANPSDAVTIIVSARTGGMDGDVRVVREVVTTVPTDHVATLEIPIEFLCVGQATLAQGDAASTCPSGQTCIGGVCADEKVDSSTLPVYSPESVFGDGSCFDATSCWTAPVPAMVDTSNCTIPNTPDINVALQTEGQGICGPAGCFVTLDAASPTGWTIGMDGLIHLPASVCAQLTANKIVNVVTAPLTSTCKEKKTSLPTCGPWSAATKNTAPYVGPLALSGGQARPVSITLGGGNVYWTNAGLGAGASGALKGVAPGGGAPVVLASMGSQAPRDLLVATVGATTSVYWSSAPGAAASGAIYSAPLAGGSITTVVSGLDVPEGIAVGGGQLFWADFQGGGISQAPLGGGASTQVAQGNYPYRVVADDSFVYWTNEGTAGTMPPDGSLMRYDYATSGPMAVTIAPAQDTPRAIAIDAVGGGATQAIYWANFTAKGALMRVKVTAAGVAMPEVLVSGLDYPNGIAVDDTYVYWTNRGDGTVLSLPKTAVAGAMPTTLASGQLAPGAIAVDMTNVYWVNEGSSSAPSGAIIKLPKPQ